MYQFTVWVLVFAALIDLQTHSTVHYHHLKYVNDVVQKTLILLVLICQFCNFSLPSLKMLMPRHKKH